MKRIVLRMVLLATAAVLTATSCPRLAWADAPPDRVVVMYFHRTERCPTCRKMGSYSEEAVDAAFAEQRKLRVVEFHYVDFQDEKNAKLTAGYKISGPALIVAKIVDTKVAEYEDLEGIWDKVADKEAFLLYVQQQIAAYRE